MIALAKLIIEVLLSFSLWLSIAQSTSNSKHYAVTPYKTITNFKSGKTQGALEQNVMAKYKNKLERVFTKKGRRYNKNQ